MGWMQGVKERGVKDIFKTFALRKWKDGITVYWVGYTARGIVSRVKSRFQVWACWVWDAFVEWCSIGWDEISGTFSPFSAVQSGGCACPGYRDKAESVHGREASFSLPSLLGLEFKAILVWGEARSTDLSLHDLQDLEPSQGTCFSPCLGQDEIRLRRIEAAWWRKEVTAPWG